MEAETKYAEFVEAIRKSGDEIKDSLTPEDCNLWHMATLASTEAGELLDAVKKAVVYRKPLDIANVKEELGDLEYALQAIRTHFGWCREEILAGNVIKLSKRYPAGVYTNYHAINREDKQ